MCRRPGTLMAAAILVFAMSFAAMGTIVYIGGPGSTSTEYPTGPEGLLSGGETATATLEFVVSESGGSAILTLTVTNTSPAILGTQSPTLADAPVISDILFCAPTVVTGMTLDTVGGVAAAGTGWEFYFDPDSQPGIGFGFLKNNFDALVEGGPPGSPAPVIASIYDPDIADGPGDPIASPVDFVLTLTFGDGAIPSGFTADWFIDDDCLGVPPYLGAAKFMSGANGGSATVTDGGAPVPAPTALMALVSGLALLGSRKLRRAF